MKRDDFFMLDTMTPSNVRFNRKARLGAMIPLSLGAALSLLLQVQVGAAGEPLPIRKLSVNEGHQIVIEYASGTGKFPTKPTVQDLTGTNHRLVLDFPDAVIDRSAMPPAKVTLDELTKVFPDVRGIRYAALTGGTAPTARIVLDLPQTLQVKPHIVTLGESSVTIDLGLTPAAAAAPATTDSATASASQPDATAGTRIQPPAVGMPAGADEPPAVATSATPAPTPAAEPTNTAPPAPAAVPEKSKTDIPQSAVGTPPTSAPAAAPSPEPAQAKAEAVAPSPAAVSEPVTEKSAISSAIGASTTGSAPAATPEPAPTEPTKEETTPVESKATKPTTSELTQNTETLESRSPAHDVDAPKPDPESQATMAASSGKGYDPKTAREAAAAEADKMAAEGTSNTDAGNTAASAAIPGANQATVQDTAAGQKAAALRADADRHFKAAVKFHMANELPAAIVEYKATIAVNPNLAEPYCNLGLIYNQQHNYQAALDEFHKALAVNPKDAITYNGVGAALRAQKDMVGAMKNWQTAVSLDPKLATALYNLGTAYEMQKDFDKALDSYKQAATQDSRLGEAYYRMGLILQKRNNPSEAIEEFNKALKASTRAEYSDDARQRIALLSKHSTH